MPKPQTKPTQKQTPVTPATTPKPEPKLRSVKELQDLAITASEEMHRIVVELKKAEAVEEELSTYRLVQIVDGYAAPEDHSSEITADEYGELRKFLKILRQDHGTSTPIDEFVARLVFSHNIRAMTPDSIQEDLDQCREAFQDALRDSKQLQKQYPELFSDSEAA